MSQWTQASLVSQILHTAFSNVILINQFRLVKLIPTGPVNNRSILVHVISWQAITWINDDPGYCGIYGPPVLNGLMPAAGTTNEVDYATKNNVL